MKNKRTTSAATLACTAGLLATATPAHAVNKIVDISDATLTQRTISGSYTVQCEGDSGFVFLDITQATGQGLFVSVQQEIQCGEELTFTYSATPQRGTFRPGTATAMLTLVSCLDQTCFPEATTTEEIQMTRR